MNEKSKNNINNSSAHNQKHSKYLPAIVFVIGAVIIGLGFLVAINSSTTSNQTLPQSRDIFTLYDTYNMTVVVVFDEEPPIVQFIAPNGSYVDMENIRYRHGGNFVQYFMPNAIPGTWQMAYDPLSNTEITTPYSVYMNHIFIRNFDTNISAEADEDISIKFEVSADDAGEFNYELHAVFIAPDNGITDEILLVKGYGMLNEQLTLAVDIGELQDMGGFMLRLTVYVQYGQAAIRDTAWLDLRLR